MILSIALVAPAVRGETFHLFPPASPAAEFFQSSDGDRELGLWGSYPPGNARGAGEPSPFGLAPSPFSGAALATPAPYVAPKLFTTPTAITTAIVVGGVTLGLGLVGIQYGYNQPFGFTAEKYFGKDTYAGGADKCSHFILSATLSRELGWVYEQQGHPQNVSLALSTSVVSMIGVFQEIEDGLTSYGFSWEDVSADVTGALTGAALTYWGLNDLIGIRYGLVPDTVPNDPCCTLVHTPSYDDEFYSGDLKIAGLAERMHFNPGPARFLLLSATYCVRAYGTEPVRPDRQRNVGIDIGLNLPEILKAAGVPSTTWWGTALYKVLNFVRIPFTAFGVRYDLNHKKWHGPDTGQNFD